MSRSRLRRCSRTLAAVATVLAVSATGLSASAAAAPRPHRLSKAEVQPVPAGATSTAKSVTGGLARTPSALERITSPKLVPVMIKYDYDAAASYTGTVPGYPATSPSVTKRSLHRESPEATRYLSYLKTRQERITRRIEAVAPGTRVHRGYRVVYGGVAAQLPGNAIRAVLRVPGVVAVQRDALRQPLTDASSRFINATAAYRSLGTVARAGKGILFGDLDTGLWPEHPSFADHGHLPAYKGPSLPCDFGDNPLTPGNHPFRCNDKLVGGAAFTTTYDEVNGSDYPYAGTARDSDGHGSHTSSTAAGDIVHHVRTIGPVVPRINGMAPGAQIMEYKVCGSLGCYTSDTTEATEQAILDGVKVINFSISGGVDPLTDPTELAFLDAYNAGVFVAASAGNDGPTAGTVNHVSPWVTSVAASTQKREFDSTLTLTAADGATYRTHGASITHGVGPLPVVRASAAPYSDPLCQTPAPAGTFTGKIVVCERGVNARVTKGYNVLQGGAAGMILYNPTLADVETDNHWLPAVHIADGTDLVAFLDAHPQVTGRFTAGSRQQGQGDVMAAFSSRGPAPEFLKPDITAPGVQILAAMTPTPEDPELGPPGQYYQAIAGTSMASPHIAGSAILIQAVHPHWTPGQIKSAMMTQAVTHVVKEDGTTHADPFDMGAGRIDVGAADRAPLTISDTAAHMAALTADPLHAIDLNIPSINAPQMPGRVTTTRTLQNVTRHALRVRPSASVPARTRISFSPRRLKIPVGASRRVRITIRSSAATGAQQFAAIRFRTNAGTAHVPVAFVHRQGAVRLDQSCAAPSVPTGRSTVCTVTASNTGFDQQDVSLRTTTSPRLRVVAATGATVSGRRAPRATASAHLAGAVAGVPSLGPGSSPAGGYVDLAGFGIAAIPVGDEELQTFDTPSFTYNGQSWSTIDVDSNGYLVVGGSGDASNNQCCDLPSGPSSSPPNNVLAPFWTDLDGTGATGLRVGALTDGTSSWVVVQWQVNVFGTTDTRAFQVWIGTNDDGSAAQDISYTYSAAQGDPNGQPFLVGAENVQGIGDMSSVLPDGTDQVVTSTDPQPGDSVSYRVRVKGLRPGPAVVRTEMDASRTRGTTTVDTPVRVTR
jgi:subtilase family protein/PA domain-containing protein/fibronectin type III domain protein